MFVRQQGMDLHLLSSIFPAWIEPGSVTSVNHVPTDFGTVDLSLRVLTPSRAELTLHDDFVDPPAHIILHLPWFMETSKVVANGVSLPFKGGSVQLPVHARTVQIDWKRRPSAPDLSYAAAVAEYKQEYAAHYKEFLRSGQ